MQEKQIQEYLFQRIREMLPESTSLADCISELLHLSQDSAYRRIRGETPLILEEARILCKHFSISLDQLLDLKSDSIIFTSVSVEGDKSSFKNFLLTILHGLQQIAAGDEKLIIYLSKELVLFHNFLFKPLFAFQYYFWMKSLLDNQDMPMKFSVNMLTKELEDIGLEIARLYYSIPSIEII